MQVDQRAKMSQFSLYSGYSPLRSEDDTVDRERIILEKEMEKVNKMIREANILHITRFETNMIQR